LAPPENWVLFPGESGAIFAIAGVLLFLHVMQWFGLVHELGQAASILLPYVVLITFASIAIAVQRLAYRSALRTTDVRSLWRYRMIGLASRVRYFFIVPLVFYLVISILQRLSLTLVQRLPIRPPTDTTVSGNVVITRIGHPDIASEEEMTRVLSGMFAPHLLATVLLAAILVACGFYITVLRSMLTFGIKEWELDAPFQSAVASTVRPIARLARSAILLQWLLHLIINLTGAAILIFGVLWVTHLIPRRLPVDWVTTAASPFVWYGISVESVLGRGLGTIVSLAILFALFLPGLIWLVFSVISLGLWWTQSLGPLLLARRPGPGIGVTVFDLSKRLDVQPPQVRLKSSIDFPRTVPVLPFDWGCLILLPSLWAETAPRDQLDVVLAHELVHVKRHASKLWWATTLSRLSLVGPGFLTLLYDRRAMELEADEQAVGLTGSEAALGEALETESDGIWTGKELRKSVGITPIARVYRLYFLSRPGLWDEGDFLADRLTDLRR
jgi:hypothetical protein